MNYTEHLKGFYLRRQVKSISYNALTLYYLLTEQFNSCGFPRTMPIPVSKLAKESGLTRRQIIKARQELIDKGYIKIVPVPCRKSSLFDIPTLITEQTGDKDIPEASDCLPMLPCDRLHKGSEDTAYEKI